MVWDSRFKSIFSVPFARDSHVLYMMPTDDIGIEIHEFSPWQEHLEFVVLFYGID